MLCASQNKGPQVQLITDGDATLKKNVLSDLILKVLERTHTVRLEAEHREVEPWFLEPAALKDTPKVKSLLQESPRGFEHMTGLISLRRTQRSSTRTKIMHQARFLDDNHQRAVNWVFFTRIA